VLQAYGLTETTAICTLDDPLRVAPGRVGLSVPGVEMKLAENGEILARARNIFPGYWHGRRKRQRRSKTVGFTPAIRARWMRRILAHYLAASKNLIILNSGHNIAPDPLEEELARHVPEAQRIILVGNQRSFSRGVGDS